MWFNIWYCAVQICMKMYIFDIGFKSVPSCQTNMQEKDTKDKESTLI